jgi:bla regulator protein blaR1
MASELLQMLTLTTLAMTFALLLMVAIRTPLRRHFGARIAYLAWWVVPLAMLAVLLPAPVQEVATLTQGALVTIGTGPLQALPVEDATATLPDYRFWLPLLWACGVAVAALLFQRMQRRYVRALGELSPAGEGVFVSQSAGACPAVVGAWKPRIVLPADFAFRYPLQEGEMVMAHERAHLRRGDAAVNLAVVALRSVYWFNPLLHWATSRFRQDQEMACDAMVLTQFPHRRRSYAEAMLKTQLAVLGLPVGCHWQSSQALKERILMLKQPLPGKLRRGAGMAGVLAVLAASTFIAWASQPANRLAPVYQGYVDDHAVAIASVSFPDGLEVDMEGAAAMSTPSDKVLNAILNPYTHLTLKSRDAESPWSLLLQAAGSASAPTIEWTLTRNGRSEGKQTQPIGKGAMAIDLAAVADAQGRFPRILVARMPADRVVSIEKYGNPAQLGLALASDGDGVFRQAEPLRVVGDYKRDGKATLLLDIGTDGRVSKVGIEEMTPAGALSDEDARDLVLRNVYEPQRINGKAVASRVRVPIWFWRNTPAHEVMFPNLPKAEAKKSNNAPQSSSLSALETEPTLIFSGNVTTKLAPGARNAIPDRPVEIKDAPPPTYPADALSRKQDGKVVLIVDIGADGSVTKARVDTSNPPTVFDVAALEAVKKWKFTPAMEQGEAVPGKVRIPITFEADTKADGAVAGPGSGKQYVWHRNAAEPPLRETFCDVMRVQQSGKTGDISGMECGIAAATDGK